MLAAGHVQAPHARRVLRPRRHAVRLPRAAARDFIDVSCLVRDGHFTMDELVGLAARKDPGIDVSYRALAFQQADNLPDTVAALPLTLLGNVDLVALKAFFRSEAVRLLASRLDRQ